MTLQGACSSACRLRTLHSVGTLAALVALWACVFVPSAQAQRLQTYVYTELDGLPSAWVDDVAQDPSGRIWFATRAGLSCFDGRDWKLVDVPLRMGLAQHLASSDSELWALGADLANGVARLDERFELVEPPAGLEGSTTVVDAGAHANTLWVATPHVVASRRAGEWSVVALPRGAVARRLSVAEDGVLVATTAGVVAISGGKLRPVDTGPAYAVAAGRRVRDEAWVAGPEGVSRLFEGRRELEVEWGERYEQLPLDGDTSLLSEPALGVFVANPLALLQVEGERFRELGIVEGIASVGAMALFVDRDQNLWVAGRRGVTRVPRPLFSTYTREQGLFEDEVTAILEPRPDELVFGHNQALTVRGPGGLTTVDLAAAMDKLAPMGRVLDMASDPDGGLWLATGSPGLLRLDAEHELQRRWGAGSALGGPVRAVVVRPDGEVVAGSHDGVFRLAGDTFEELPGAPQQVRKLLVRASGDLVAGTVSGVALEQRGAWTVVRDPGDPNASQIYALHEVADSGDLLVGTLAGLRTVRGEQLVAPSTLPALGYPVYAILEDSAGRLWFGTDRGISRWSGDELVHYSVRDGLAGQETNRAALFETTGGELWVGTSGGVSRYNARHDVAPEPPAVELERLALDGVEVSLAGLDVPRRARDLVAQFRSISFAGDAEVRYRCRLLGYEEGWIDEALAEDGRVRYTNLAPGTYQLEVQARTRRSEWGPAARTGSIELRGPITEHWWFQLTAAAGALGLVAVLLALATSRRRSAALERLVEERTAALGESERRYREMFEHTPLAQVLLDPETERIRDANPAACALYEAARSELVGRRFVDVSGHSLADLSVLRDHSAGTVGEDELHPRPARVDEGRPTGNPAADFEVHVCDYTLGGESVVQATLIHVGERRRLERELRRSSQLRALGQLAGGVAHDFNNLLTTILGVSDLLLGSLDSGDGAIRKDVEAIKAAGERGAALVRHLLAFSSQQHLRPEVLAVNEVVGKMASLLRRTLGDDVGVETKLGDASCIEVDRGEIERVLLNLALNARDAMPRGGELVFETRSTLEHVRNEVRPCNVIVVRDSGVGMSPEVQARVFEPFFTTKATGRGNGLGLSTAYGIIVQSGGSMRVKSRPGGGTEFDIRLPACEKVPEPPPVDVEFDEPDTSVGGPRTVLLVEDDATVRELSAGALRAHGLRVLEAADGVAALEVAESEVLDLLVTDVVMPRMGGPELARALRDQRPDLGVLFMSGYPGEVPGEELEAYGQDFLSKPFTGSELRQRVARLIDAGDRVV